jgi:DNA-binding ferritin-like protein
MGTATDMTMKQTADGIVGSYDTRIAALGNLKSGVHKTLNDFASNRETSSKEQAVTLARFVKDVAQANAEMCEQLTKASSLRHKASLLRHKDVNRMLGEFKDNHGAMATELTASLKQFDTGIGKEVSSLLKGFAKDHDRMSRKLHGDLSDWVSASAKETQDLLGGFQRDITAAHSAWVDLSKTMAVRRGGEGKPSTSTDDTHSAPKSPRRTHPKHKATR